MTTFTTALIYGSVRSERKGILVANYLKQQLTNRNHRVHFIDPKVYHLPLLDKMFKEYKNEDAPEPLGQLSKMLTEADGFVIVTGEYNHSTPPALKNLLDHFQREYFFKPSAIASYSAGRFGGVRGAMQLQSIVAELGMSSIPSMLPIPKVKDAFDKNNDPVEDFTNKATQRFLDEYEWYLEALKTQRSKGTPY